MAELEPPSADEQAPVAASPPPDPPTGVDGDAATVAKAMETPRTIEEKANLVAFLTEDEQKKIVSACIERYERDITNSTERMKRRDAIQKMYALVTKQKNHPFQNCANIMTPTVTAPVLQISARLYDMTWPATGKVFNVVAASMADMEPSRQTEQFSNSYVRYTIPDFSLSLKDTIHQKCLYGSAFRRTYWDSYTRRVRCNRIGIEDFVAPYAVRDSDPSMSNLPHYTWAMHITLDEIHDIGEAKLYENADKCKEGQDSTIIRSQFHDTTKKIGGVEQDDDNDDNQRIVIEQHFRLKLPKRPDQLPLLDGKRHHVYAVIDTPSKALLRLCVREEDDPDDRRRYDRDSAKFQAYLEQKRMLLAALEGQQAAMAQAQAAMMLPPEMPPLPPEPEPPLGLDEKGGPRMPDPIRKRAIPFFTHYQCFPSEGFYGLGYGDLIYGIAIAMNTILNQFADSGSLRNAKPAFMSNLARLPRGDVNVSPGSVNSVDGPIASVRDAIMFLDPPTTDPGTIPLIKMLDAMKDTLAGNADLMSGQPPGSNQTKAGMQILSEQMMMPLSVLASQTREELKHDLMKIWRCLGVFLDEEDIQEFLNVETGQPEQAQLTKAMFSPTVHLMPASDPRSKSQRAEDFQSLFAFVMGNPYIQQGPAALPIMRAVTEQGFKMFPDGERYISLLPELPPPGPPPPPPPKPQYAENAGFLRGEDYPVHPEDDHEQHARDVHDFMDSPEAQAMDKAGRQMAEKHYRAHLAAIVERRGAMQNGEGNAPFGSAGVGPGAMAGPADLAALGQALA